MEDEKEPVPDELNVSKLLEKHRAVIDEAKARMRDELDAAEHDDIFLLRYVLSYKTVDKVCEMVRGGIEYRKKNDYLKLAKQNRPHPAEEEINKWTVAGFHGFKKDGGPVHVIRSGLANVSGLFSKLSVREVVEEMTMKKEQAYIICDRVTRETGRLTKQIVIMDLSHQGFFYPSQALIQSQNDASAIAKLLYPQLLEKVIILQAPWFFQQVWKIATMVLSESLTSKVALCYGTIAPGQLNDCPWASKHLNIDEVPSFAGGSCECEGGCIGGVPNDWDQVMGNDEVEQEYEEAEEQKQADGAEKKPPQEGEGKGGWFSGWF